MEYFLIGIITILIAALIFFVHRKRTATTISRAAGDNETGRFDLKSPKVDRFQGSNIVKVLQLPLTYLLGKCEISKEMSCSIYNTDLNKSNQMRVMLEGWHEEQAGLLSIEIDRNRIMKKGDCTRSC